jgi:hypothetical protein
MAEQIAASAPSGVRGTESGYHPAMTQRSLVAGLTPTVIVRAGADVTVEGAEGDRVLAENETRGGLQLGRRSESEFGRLRAVAGERVLLDLRVDLPKRWRKGDPEAIEVQLGGSGRVRVPQGSSVKVFAGRHVTLSGVAGKISVTAGGDASLSAVGVLAQASAGGALDVNCQALEGDEPRLQAGRDLRCYVAQLDHARVLVNDLGGSWEGLIGAGGPTLRLKAGGDVTLVTSREVVAQGPDYVIGRIEKPEA